VATKKKSKTRGTSGGAAAAVGIGFQARVAALAMAHALIDNDDLTSLTLDAGATLSSIHLETEDDIDDVVVLGDRFRMLIQAKRNVSASDGPASEFSSAIGQFVRHHRSARQAGDRYVLATTLRSSDRIVYDLRKLTESLRLNADALRSDPLTKAESDVLRKTRQLVSGHLQALNPGEVTEAEIDEILRSIWILPLDVESGGRDEALAVTLLKRRSIVEPKLIWSALLELASTLAQRRGSVDLAGLRNRFSHLIKPAGEQKTAEDEVRPRLQQMNQVSAGKEVAVLEGFPNSGEITIAEFYRFAEDGRRRLAFKGDVCTLMNGEKYKLLYRSATT